MFSPSLDGGAPMSADERPFRLEKKGNRRIGSKQAGVARCRRNEGLAPVREEIGSKRVRPIKADVIFLQSARSSLARLSAHEPGRDDAPSDPPIIAGRGRTTSVEMGAQNA